MGVPDPERTHGALCQPTDDTWLTNLVVVVRDDRGQVIEALPVRRERRRRRGGAPTIARGSAKAGTIGCSAVSALVERTCPRQPVTARFAPGEWTAACPITAGLVGFRGEETGDEAGKPLTLR